MFHLSCFSCVGESVRYFPMVNVGAGEAAMSGVATERAGRGLGCVVVVCEFKAKFKYKSVPILFLFTIFT